MQQPPPQAIKDMPPAMPHQQNTFGILGQNKSDNYSVETVTTQVAALT
jgi:hypothetical protein